ncbi:MAG: peptidylprolyl isomerase [Deltaproteobacteria bacterium]|nr:peptidylprolyl isomerase [Deltaproteobacteria bacterium]
MRIMVMGLLGCLAIGWGIAGCTKSAGYGAGQGKVLVAINGDTITEGDLEFLTTINPRLKGQITTPFGQKQILDNLTEQTLLFQESTRRGLDHDPEVKAKIDLYRRVIIAQAALDNEMEQAAKQYYEEHKGEFEKVELSHILIRFKSADAKNPAPKGAETTRTEDQALAIATQVRKRLAEGEEFSVVAKEVSEDTGSKNAGGMLGRVWKQEPRLERRGYGPLLEKAFTMQVGAVEGPIKTQEGYHLITVTKGVESQTYEEAKQALYFKVQGDIRTKFLADLKQKAKITYAEGLAEPEKKPSETPTTPTPETGSPPAGAKPEAAPETTPAPQTPPPPAPPAKAPAPPAKAPAPPAKAPAPEQPPKK